ncbi:MAG: PIN domain-containing protein [Nitrospirae bacterium]|nr:PIN domain-containing protein [Nitrospirota bacterium]
MRYKVFLDTNILLSGIFFKGNESTVLDLVEVELVTSEDAVAELHKVVNKKLKYLKDRTLEIALLETQRALSDITILKRSKYNQRVKEAETLITHKKDALILASVLYAKPDYFLTGDAHFFSDKIKNIIPVLTAKEFLAKIKKR